MHSKKAVLAVAVFLILSSLSCTNPITRYFSTQTAIMETATATMWTPTPTNTPTFTPTFTPTETPTYTLTPTPDNRFYETGGAINFSYIPPKSWRQSADSNGLTQWEGKGTTILTFNIQQSDLDATMASVAMVSALKSALSSFTVADSGAFSPDSGLDAYRSAFTANYQGVAIYGELYAFSGSGYLVEALYLRPESSDANQDALVLDSMMTLRFD